MLAQRLRLARTAHDKDLAAFSRLIGIRVDHVRAIEDGRFSDLPAGIYGRAAVKAYAAACGLDAAAVLADAEAWLVSMDDPIITLSPTFACACPRALGVLVTATVVGLLTGFLGVGGGFLVVPALLVALALPMEYATGTSLVVITMTSATALAVRIGSERARLGPRGAAR